MNEDESCVVAGVDTWLWSVEDLVAVWESYEQPRAERAAVNANRDLVARELFIFLGCATMAFFLGKGYHKSFRSGVLRVKGRTYRRDNDPALYWISMAIGTFGFLVMVSGAAVMAFLICVDLFGTSK